MTSKMEPKKQFLAKGFTISIENYKANLIGLKMPPVMPSLNINPLAADDDDAEEALEDENIMTILLKLNKAKTSIKENKKMKHNQKIGEECLRKFHEDSIDIVNKHNKRWQAKTINLGQKFKKLRFSIEERKNSNKLSCKRLQDNINNHKLLVSKLFEKINSFQLEYTNSNGKLTENNNRDIARVKQQVVEKLNELQSVLQKSQMESHKEDKLNKLIKNVLITF